MWALFGFLGARIYFHVQGKGGLAGSVPGDEMALLVMTIVSMVGLLAWALGYVRRMCVCVCVIE
jgi:hypothetical protein